MIAAQRKTCGFALIVSIVFAFGMSPARAEDPKICNGTSIVISVAIAWWGAQHSGLHSEGWFTVQPGECRQPFPYDSRTAHRYYFAYNEYDPQHPELSRSWSGGPGDGNGWCLSEREFSFEEADNCPAGTLRRVFIHVESADYERAIQSEDYVDPDVTLTWDTARPGSLAWGN